MLSASAPRAFVLGNFVLACCWHVGRQPMPGETLEADHFHAEPGGKGLNVAIGLRRLGADVHTLIGCGQDRAADALLALLTAEGLPNNHVHRLPGASGWGSGLIGADGHNSIAVYLGANRLLTEEHAHAARGSIGASQLVYGQFETSLAAVEAAFAIAHAHGVPTVLNPSPWHTPPQALADTTHTLIVNAVEAAALLNLPGDPVPTAAQAAQAVAACLPALGGAWPALCRLVITLGAEGALGMERAAQAEPWRAWHAAAPRIQAIDTVGAGDAFASGYCTAVLAGQPLPVALAWGNLCGAHVATQRGVLTALPGAAWLHQALAGTVDGAVPLSI